MKILILTEFGDPHAGAVKWALEQHDCEVDIVLFSDFPQQITISYLSDLDDVCIEGASLPEYQYWDVIWNRRTAFCNPHDELSANDRRMARYIGNIYLDAAKSVLGKNSFWVNGYKAASHIENKLAQLQIAKKIGFNIPTTLISNDPARIRQFVGSSHSCIVKPLAPMVWTRKDDIVAMHTSKISTQDLANDVPMSACSMIYQHEVEKRVEYRVIVMGHEIIALELDSQSVPEAATDWRNVSNSRINIRRTEIEPEVQKRILNFMSEAEIVFGSFDFAMTPDGETVFFECNQQGQFLWVEAQNADIPLLDTFAQFLQSANRRFKSDGGKQSIRFADYARGEARTLFNDSQQKMHVPIKEAEQAHQFSDS